MCKKFEPLHSFAAAIRDLTPGADNMNDFEVCAKWQPSALLFSADEYGGEFCTCGHPIKHVFEIALKDNPSVRYSPVGSVCVNAVFGEQDRWKAAISLENDLRKMVDTIEKTRDSAGYHLTELIVKPKMGFTRRARAFLWKFLPASDCRYIDDLAQRKAEAPKSERQKRYLHFIAARVVALIRNAKGMTVH